MLVLIHEICSSCSIVITQTFQGYPRSWPGVNGFASRSFQSQVNLFPTIFLAKQSIFALSMLIDFIPSSETLSYVKFEQDKIMLYFFFCFLISYFWFPTGCSTLAGSGPCSELPWLLPPLPTVSDDKNSTQMLKHFLDTLYFSLFFLISYFLLLVSKLEYVKLEQDKIMLLCTMIYVLLFSGHGQNTGREKSQQLTQPFLPFSRWKRTWC